MLTATNLFDYFEDLPEAEVARLRDEVTELRRRLDEVLS